MEHSILGSIFPTLLSFLDLLAGRTLDSEFLLNLLYVWMQSRDF